MARGMWPCRLIILWGFLMLIGCMTGCTKHRSDQCSTNQQCGQDKYCEVDGNCYPVVQCLKDEDCGLDEFCSSIKECRKNIQPDGGGDDGDGGEDGGSSLPDIPICDEMEIEAGSVPPNLLLVVDKSGSMKDPTSSGSSRTKIQDTKDAVNALLDQGDGKIRFGWMEFPQGGIGSCDPGIVTVQCSNHSVSTIRNEVSNLSASGGTPTGESLENANDYQDLHDATRNNFVVLLTDGMPTCPNGDGSSQNEADALLALNAVTSLHDGNIDTFVIGLGEDINNSNPDLLNDMAEAGGRPRAGAVKYYQANSLQELQTVLEDIGGMVIGCNLKLTVEPQWPDYLWVLFDDQVIPRDPDRVDGWDYDGDRNQIDFFGPVCEQLRTGEVAKVDILMGCEPPP